MGIIKKFIKFIKLPVPDKLMRLEAMIYSAKYRWQILHRPFKEMAPSIGTFKHETELVDYDARTLRAVERAVVSMGTHVSWDSKCLDQALTAKKMLNKRGYPCTLYMGVIQNEQNEMTAHAWLRCGTRYISGGNGDRRGYAITAIYGDEFEKLD